MASKQNRTKNSIRETSMSTHGGTNVSVRKIDNGFIVRHSGYKGKNKEYFERERFSRTNPIKITGVTGMRFGGKK